MAAEEHYERREERQLRDAAGRPVQQVERVEQTEAASNVRPFPAGRATNVNVAPPPVAAGPAYVDAEPHYAGLAVGKANQILWFICGVLELALAGRLVLRLVGANPAAPFVAFMYAITQPFAAPFLGMLPNLAGPSRGAFLEVPTAIAMLVYFLLFLLVTTLLRVLVSRPRVVA